MAIPLIERGLMNKEKKRRGQLPELRSRIASIDKEILLFLKKKGRRFVKPKELREILERCGMQLTLKHLWQIIREGQIKSMKIDGRIEIDRTDLNQWLRYLEKRGIANLHKRGLIVIDNLNVNKFLRRE